MTQQRSICLLYFALAPLLAGAAEPKRGIVVLSVPKDTADESAGIKAGDVLETWSRSRAEGGRLTSPFDIWDLETNRFPLGPVSVKGRRSGQKHTWVVRTSSSNIMLVRPVLTPQFLLSYEQADELRKSGRRAEAAAAMLKAADRASSDGPKAEKPWFLYMAARWYALARLWEETDRAYAAALKAAEPYGPPVKARLLGQWADSWLRRQNWVEAEQRYRLQLAEYQKLGRETLLVAQSFVGIGSVAWQRGDLDVAGEYYRRALEIDLKLAPVSMETAFREENFANVASRRGDQWTAMEHYQKSLAIKEKLQPGSLEVANTLDNLGLTANRRGDLASAEIYHREALALFEKLAPASLDTAYCLNNLGMTLNERGDLGGAEDFFKHALNLKEKLVPESPTLAITAMNLGLVAEDRGDLDKAEKYLNQSLAIREKLQPGSLEVADALQGLGNLHLLRSDLDRAEQAYQSALAIVQKQAPGTDDEATKLNDVGSVARLRGDFAKAEDYYRRSLMILEKAQPGSLVLASSIHDLGLVALGRKNFEEAERLFKQALALRERLASGTLHEAESLLGIADLAGERQDFKTAENNARHALAIRQKLAPGSADEAEALHAVGGALRGQGDIAGAVGFFCQAVTALESQTARLGGTEDIKAGFRANFAAYYADCLESLVAANRPEEAFAVLERSRARSLLKMLAERDLNFASDAPAELLRERKLNAADYDRTQSEIAQLTPSKDAAKIDALLAKMRDLNTERQRISAKIREASPRLASLQYPQPLDLAGTQKMLDPGTVLLAYSVGESETILFSIRPAGTQPNFAVDRLKIGEKELRQRVQAFRNLVERRSGDLDKPAAELYDMLLRPADAAIGASARVLIVPDGPLHALPFAALRRDGQYLVEWKPLHTSVSSTVYSELKKSRASAKQPTQLAAFGDPQYPKADGNTQPAELRSVRTRGFALQALPASREEVRKIGDLYPEASRRVYVGTDATEEQAKALGRDVHYIHFATHALLDEQFPLNSALVLSLPKEASGARENGLLQAWEIFEQVRINADLVALSACETGLGQEMGGEGLIGLTRAFQYAGARSILASLWSVADSSTADLMEHFYQNLKSGQSKDQALRAAQMEEMRRPENAHPFYWAAFSLIGDWVSAN